MTYERFRAVIDTDYMTGMRGLRVVSRALGGERFALAVSFAPISVGASVPIALSETREERDDKIGDVTGFLQSVIDAAWEDGMRPSAAKDATEELKAVRYHLEDMRSLAFSNSKDKP